MNELASKGAGNDTPEEKMASAGWNSAVSAYNGFSSMKSGNAVDRLKGVAQAGEALTELVAMMMA